jgi:predicted Na+-dependent transporter
MDDVQPRGPIIYVTGGIMFLVGLNTHTANFRSLVVRGSADHSALVTTLLSTMVIIPTIATAVLSSVSLPTPAVLGIMITALCPGGPMANIFAALVGANVELNATLTACEQMLSGLLLPFGLLYVLPAAVDLQDAIQVPYEELVKGISFVVLPLVSGIIISHCLDACMDAAAKQLLIRRLLVAIALMVALLVVGGAIFIQLPIASANVTSKAEAAVSEVAEFIIPSAATFRAASYFGIITVAWGVCLGYLLPRQPAANRSSIVLEVGIRDLGMMLPIITFGLSSSGVAFQTQVLSASICAFLWTNLGSVILLVAIKWLLPLATGSGRGDPQGSDNNLDSKALQVLL